MSTPKDSDTVQYALLRSAQVLVLTSFLLPLVVVTSSFIFPFVVPRVLFFRIVISLALLAYILLCAMDWKRYRPKWDVITAAVAFYFLSLILSTVFSVDVHRSVWDNHERMLGLYTLLHYGFLYFIAQNVFRTWKEWRVVWSVFMIFALPAFAIGIIQIFRPEFLLNRDATRIASTLGNPIYVSAHAIFVFLLSIYLYLKEQGIMRQISFLIGLLAFINFMASDTRGTTLGFIVAIPVTVLAIVFFARHHKGLQKAVVGLLAVAVVAGVILFVNREKQWVGAIPVAGRVLNIKLKGTTAETRFIAWRIAVDAWRAHPILGWGPVNYFYIFNQYYNPRSFLHGLQETWFDNAHSMIFNTLAERGGLGLLAYLFIFLAPLAVLFKNKGRPGGMLLFLFGLAFLTTHFIHNLIVFENVTSYLYFFLFLAFVSAFTRFEGEMEGAEEARALRSAPPMGVTVIATLVVLFMIYAWNINVARANRAAYFGIQSFQQFEAGVQAFREVVQSPTPHIDDVRSDMTTALLKALPQPKSEQEARFMVDAILFARAEEEKTLQLRGRDLRIHMTSAMLDRALYFITKDPQYLLHADALYAAALELSPKRQELLFQRAMNALIAGDNTKAIAYLEEAVALEPGLVIAQIQLAKGAAQVGDIPKAAGAMRTALSLAYVPSDDNEKRATVQMLVASPMSVSEFEGFFAELKMKYSVHAALYDELLAGVKQLRGQG